jgi:hypothetical protein
MPRRQRPGEWAILYAEIKPELHAALKERAATERRSVTAELTIALERHLGAKSGKRTKKKGPADG